MDNLHITLKNKFEVSFSKKKLSINIELLFAILSGLFWGLGILVFFIKPESNTFMTLLFIVGILFGGYYTVIEALKAVFKGKFQIDFLMFIAAIGAAILGKWGEANLLLFLFSLGHALEHYAMDRARKSIHALTDLVTHVALVRRNGQVQEINVEDVLIGDTIIIKPNSKIPADGLVVKGLSSVDQSPITGESIPVSKQAGDSGLFQKDFTIIQNEHKVFAGTINGNHVLEVKVMKLHADSTLSKLIQLVKEAESQKSPTQHLADNFERYYVPAVLIGVTLLLFAFLILDETFQQSFYRAMATLIAASPCALAISTPSAVLAGIARAAKQGVLIKGGKPLEDLGSVSVIAFDKTGTLTEGKPKLTHVIPYKNHSKESLLSVAVAVESLSDHPLADAIVKGGQMELVNQEIPSAENLEALIARGVRATVDGQIVHLGNRRLLEEITGKNVPQEIHRSMTKLEEWGNTAMIVHRGNEYLGLISVMDVARSEAQDTITALKKIGIQKMVMLTGDNQDVANSVAAQIGISDPLGNLLPEDKVKAVEELGISDGKVAMIGDGVNDAPAMARATVGIAMGAAGSDVALQTADIALMSDRLNNLPFAIGISRKAKSIIKQNLIISLGMVVFLVPLTILGIAEIGPAVVGHEGSTVVVVLNALRLLRYQFS